MPHGGRRPGAGAPKRNLNALKNGGQSDRATVVFAAILAHPDKPALMTLLRDAGFFDPVTHRFNRDLAGVVAFLHPRLFDLSSPITSDERPAIKDQPIAAKKTPETPPTEPRRHDRWF